MKKNNSKFFLNVLVVMFFVVSNAVIFAARTIKRPTKVALREEENRKTPVNRYSGKKEVEEVHSSNKKWYQKVADWFAKPIETLNTMSYDKLCQGKRAAEERDDEVVVIRYLERMKRMCNIPAELPPIVIELADRLFKQGNYKKAQVFYEEYIMSYPNKTESYFRASQQNIYCHYYQIRDHMRDQSMTRTTIALCQDFLAIKGLASESLTSESLTSESLVSENLNNNVFYGSSQDAEIQTVLLSSQERLFEHELHIAQQYFDRAEFFGLSSLRSAKTRIAGIAERCGPQVLQNKKYVGLHRDIAEKFGDNELVATLQNKLDLLSDEPLAAQETTMAKVDKQFVIESLPAEPSSIDQINDVPVKANTGKGAE